MRVGIPGFRKTPDKDATESLHKLVNRLDGASRKELTAKQAKALVKIAEALMPFIKQSGDR
jgi:hypothetical protein